MGIEKIRLEHILSSDRTGIGDRFATAAAGAKTTGFLASWNANDDLTEIDPSTVGGGSELSLTAPPTTGWSWVNQQSATVNFQADTMNMVAAANSAVNQINVQDRAAPGTPWTIETVIRTNLNAGNFQNCGIGWRDSISGRLVTVRLFANNTGVLMLIVSHHTSPTDSAPTNQFIEEYMVIAPWAIITIRDDGTDIKASHAIDQFTTPHTFHTEGRTSFLTNGPDRVFAYVDSGGTSSTINYAHLKIMSWAVS